YFGNGGALLLENSTVSGNSSTNSFAGGMYLYGDADVITVTIRNCTVSGNSAATGGGGILFYTHGSNPSHSLTIQNCTISNNTTTASGGGLLRFGTVGSLTLESTIIAGNTASTAAASDVRSSASANVGGNNNLIGMMDPSNNVTLTGMNNQTGSVATPL